MTLFASPRSLFGWVMSKQQQKKRLKLYLRGKIFISQVWSSVNNLSKLCFMMKKSHSFLRNLKLLPTFRKNLTAEIKETSYRSSGSSQNAISISIQCYSTHELLWVARVFTIHKFNFVSSSASQLIRISLWSIAYYVLHNSTKLNLSACLIQFVCIFCYCILLGGCEKRQAALVALSWIITELIFVEASSICTYRLHAPFQIMSMRKHHIKPSSIEAKY